MQLQPPCISDIDSWQGAFISSTSRLLLPACEVQYTNQAGQPSKKASLGATGLACVGDRGACFVRPLHWVYVTLKQSRRQAQLLDVEYERVSDLSVVFCNTHRLLTSKRPVLA